MGMGTGSDELGVDVGDRYDAGALALALRRPAPMEHILTEDGEPMLNPAELLTQARAFTLSLP